MKLIDKDAVVAYIKGQMGFLSESQLDERGAIIALDSVLSFLDTIKEKDKITVYEVVITTIDCEGNYPTQEVVERFTQKEDAEKYKDRFLKLWHKNTTNHKAVYPSWMYCTDEVSINELNIKTRL